MGNSPSTLRTVTHNHASSIDDAAVTYNAHNRSYDGMPGPEDNKAARTAEGFFTNKDRKRKAASNIRGSGGQRTTKNSSTIDV